MYRIDNIYTRLEKYRKKKGWSWTELNARLNVLAKEQLFYGALWSELAKDNRSITLNQAKVIQQLTGIKLLYKE